MKNLNQKKNNANQPDTADEDIWSETVKGVRKIKKPDINTDEPPLYIDIQPAVNIFQAYRGDSLNTLSEDNYDGIDNQTVKRFKREEYKIEAVLDLHGQTEKAAYNLVHEFVKQAYIENKRCVLIVTGKGNYHSEKDEDIFASRGILKNCVPGWLNSPELRPLILAFRHPSEANGGSGALYILLRRKRK